MRYVLAAPLLLMTALLQTSVMPAFPIFGVAPNLVLILLVCWTVARGQREAMIIVPIGGICLSLLGSQPVGVALLASTPVVLLSELRTLRLTHSDFLLAVMLVFLSSLAYEAVFLVALRLQGETVGWFAAFLRVVLPTSIVSVLFTPPIYWLVSARSSGLRRARAFA